MHLYICRAPQARLLGYQMADTRRGEVCLLQQKSRIGGGEGVWIILTVVDKGGRGMANADSPEQIILNVPKYRFKYSKSYWLNAYVDKTGGGEGSSCWHWLTKGEGGSSKYWYLLLFYIICFKPVVTKQLSFLYLQIQLSFEISSVGIPYILPCPHPSHQEL